MVIKKLISVNCVYGININVRNKQCGTIIIKNYIDEFSNESLYTPPYTKMLRFVLTQRRQ